ncbi:MAG: hypothetical protein K2J60_03265 [Acetatifactor sp.]|nr:hypothetical protein [Acetatifactor sp.]
MKCTGDGEKLQAHKIIIAGLIILMLVAAGAVIYQVRKADKHAEYMGDGYMMYLNGDGTFSFGWLPSSYAGFADPNAPNLYRWDGDMLMLEYGNSDRVLYFRKEGDTLVFQREQSVLPEDPHYSLGKLSDGITLKKIEQ